MDKEMIKELILLILQETSFEEKGIDMPASWKGYPFELLNELEEEDMIIQSGKYGHGKMVYITERRQKAAEEIGKMVNVLMAWKADSL